MLLGGYSNRFEDRAPFGSELTASTTARVKQAVLDAGAFEAAVQIRSMSVRPDQLTATFSAGPVKTVTYYEDSAAAYESQPPGSNALVEGAVPLAPGEVALSTSLAAELNYPSQISVFGGAVTLKVTGIVQPLYGEQSWRIVAADGTWATFPSEQVRHGYPAADGSFVVSWSGPASSDSVLDAVASANPMTAGVDALRTGNVTRDQLLHWDESILTVGERTYLLPSLVLVALAALIVVNLTRNRAINVRQSLEGVGMSRAQVLPPIQVALTVTLLAGTLVGCVAGLLLGWVARATVLPLISDEPLSPAPPLVASLAALIVTVVVAGLLASLVRFQLPAARSSGLGTQITQAARWIPWAFIRRIAACLLVGWSLPSLITAGSISAAGSAAMLFTAGGIFLLPDLLRLLVKTLSVRRVVTLSARRMFEADPARYSLTAVALAAAVAIPAVFGTLYATSFHLEQERNVSSIPPGQVWVSGAELGSSELVQRTAAEIASVPSLGSPMYIDYLDAYLAKPDSHGATGLWGIREATDLYALLGTELPSGEVSAVLNDGGMVVWDGAGGDLMTISPDETEAAAQITEAVSLDDLGIDVDPSITNTLAGVILSSTAESLGIPVTRDMAAIYVDVSPDTQRAAAEQAMSAGITPKAVAFNTPPQPLTFPAEWLVALAGAAAALVVMVWTVFSSQAKHLRSYATRMMSIGLDDRWPVRVLGLQVVVVVLGGLLGGMAAGVASIALFSTFAAEGELTLVIPWTYLVPVAAATAAVTVLSSLLSLTRLRSR